MPPKADANSAGDANVVKGFDARETKLLAAAYLASLTPGKIDYIVMGTLTGNTAGSLQKMFPPVKRKASEVVPSFAAFIGEAGAGNGAAPPTPAKPAAAKGGRGKKRKADEEGADAKGSDSDSKKVKTEDGDGDAETEGKKKAAPKKRGRPAKKAAEDKKASSEEDNAADAPRETNGAAEGEEELV
ncbi:hypothetical protein BDV96DRAFT_641829 [Lophiotrema nucula]|uniref:Uncharacterized protein n=1 Tax=Lophiotrema nucula TaxID=690887 RepID=A0A6A5ZK46_9PLEO|nr:hypothetical protein BDV96DRAFT_641829 [Lophiotrema nucula]